MIEKNRELMERLQAETRQVKIIAGKINEKIRSEE